MIRTALTEAMGIQYPICSAGMARVAQAELVTAVSNAGGLGCLGGVSFMPDNLRSEIAKIKAGTDKPYAVNLLLPDALTTDDEGQWAPVRELWQSLSGDDREKLAGVEALLTPGAVADQVQIVLDAAPAAVVLTFATPEWFIKECKDRGITVFSLVGSVGKAKEANDAGVDFIVAQGTEAGGHTGYASTMTLVPAVIDVVDKPVLAAGGIADGRGLAASLALGAAGVWVGTRFIASPEAYGHDNFKNRVVEGSFKDSTITYSYSGKRMRAFENKWTSEWETTQKKPAGFPGQYAVAGTRVETGYQDGDMEFGMMPVGQTMQLVHEILPAGQIVENMAVEAQTILKGLGTNQ
ncbi:NAD(P)H-dependent flavin oxidoreductase YrpB (nitropropane dioxygenase family) [Arthrobacter ulcerisalmonis]|nr:nitronate monooxygenase [Arthrobacter ulcerisalmonis]MDQ0664614.1 NAD(P)H-dependent flavin oxidoreductase YrpB (nitropropane dioxygenase family) [Arthrobacter ulcerisalmonis]